MGGKKKNSKLSSNLYKGATLQLSGTLCLAEQLLLRAWAWQSPWRHKEKFELMRANRQHCEQIHSLSTHLELRRAGDLSINLAQNLLLSEVKGSVVDSETPKQPRVPAPMLSLIVM